MDIENAKVILKKAKCFRYSSLEYTEPEELTDFDVAVSDEDLILLQGSENKALKIHWAAGCPELLIERLKKLQGRLYIEFIPEEYLDLFEENGFKICSEFCDFVNPCIKGFVPNDIIESDLSFLPQNKCDEASGLTYECESDSRGFHGDPPEWFEEWIGSEYGNVLTVTDNGLLVGLCCVNIYGFDSEKGPVLWVRELAVSSRFRGKGYGKQLLGQALYYGVKNGAKRGFLLCDVQNDKAIHLYNKFGFEKKPGRGQINMERE